MSGGVIENVSEPPRVGPLDVDAYEHEVGSNSTTGPGATQQMPTTAVWKHGRAMLKQYLQEIGYSESVLDVRAFRVKNLLGLMPDYATGGSTGGHHAAAIASSDDWAQNESDAGAALDADAEQALDDFKFLDGHDTGVQQQQQHQSPGKQTNNSDWGAVSPHAIEQLKDKYKQEKQRSKRNSTGSSSNAGGDLDDVPTEFSELPRGGRGGSASSQGGGRNQAFLDLNEALGLGDDQKPIDIDAESGDALDSSSDAGIGQRWSQRVALRSHLDGVRAMAFDPVEPVLFTASEDGTAKMWALGNAIGNRPSTGTIAAGELEPTLTLRAHDGPVLSLAISDTGETLFTGGADGAVCVWKVPGRNVSSPPSQQQQQQQTAAATASAVETHGVYDASLLIERLLGHQDAIWALGYHAPHNRLVSASADGTLRVWEPNSPVDHPDGDGPEGQDGSEQSSKVIGAPADDLIPAAVDFCSVEPQHLLVAYRQGRAFILDVESGQVVVELQSGDEKPRFTHILSHPTMAQSIVAGDDRRIRFFDNSDGRQLSVMVAHVESVSALAVDPNGLFLLSAAHDGTLRLWNIEKCTCIQEIPAHRRKHDMGVHCVAFHPSRAIIASGGADAVAKGNHPTLKVFCAQRQSSSAVSPTASSSASSSASSVSGAVASSASSNA